MWIRLIRIRIRIRNTAFFNKKKMLRWIKTKINHFYLCFMTKSPRILMIKLKLKQFLAVGKELAVSAILTCFSIKNVVFLYCF
jgi:hypothetical protein